MLARNYMTVGEAAQQACVSESLVYEWARLGMLSVYRPGVRGRGKILIAAADLETLMQSFRICATDVLAGKEALKHIH